MEDVKSPAPHTAVDDVRGQPCPAPPTDVDEVALLVQHDVAIVPVLDLQQEEQEAVGGHAADEVVACLRGDGLRACGGDGLGACQFIFSFS